ncbi:M18 family aminopeptidase [Candidatus Poriferisodalis sp.]|uniref:M18 family aminopeptidase n=1 Tax=Candidatus Poriferisodalis sp. TaxID=3101277 RepID=UPI003B59FC81
MLDQLFEFIEASPSPYHAAAAALDRLVASGLVEVGRDDPWNELEPEIGWATRDGGTVVAVRAAAHVDPDRLRFSVIGAHTDSPNLRLRPQPDSGAYDYRQLGVEVYGGVLLNSWLDRDLGLSGRVTVFNSDRLSDRSRSLFDDEYQHTHFPFWSDADEDRTLTSTAPRTVLWRCDRALLRVPQLAIHLDREVNDGLKLDRQQHMTPVWGLGEPSTDGFRQFLAGELDVEPDAVLAWDVMAHDLCPPARLGRDGEMYAAGRIDNLASCHAAVEALVGLDAAPDDTAAVVVLFDHEEIGSDSATGAGSPILADALERIAQSLGADREQYLRAVARSLCVSADGAHAVHPNYPERHEPGHLPLLNGGPVIKTNVNVRYATDAATSARFVSACNAAGVPHQIYSHRGNLPCGSTIGPITASRLGMSVVDVGSPQLSMHSARELGGSDDPALLTAALGAFLAES